MKTLTRIAYEWAIRSFGSEHVHNFPIRSLRLAEEAIELAQAFDVPKDKLHELIEMVYARPKGQFEQEIGGVMMTATVLAAATGFDPDSFFEEELRRVLRKPSEHFAKRNQEKIDLGMTA